MVILSLCYFNVLLWYPYYFELIGYHTYSSFFSIVIPISNTLGGMLFEYILKKVPHLKNKFVIGSIFLYFLSNAFLILVHKSDEQNDNVMTYFIIVIIGNLGLAGPFNRVLLR